MNFNVCMRAGDRTGTGTLAVFGRVMRFDVSAAFPLLTSKVCVCDGVVVSLNCSFVCFFAHLCYCLFVYLCVCLCYVRARVQLPLPFLVCACVCVCVCLN